MNLLLILLAISLGFMSQTLFSEIFCKDCLATNAPPSNKKMLPNN